LPIRVAPFEAIDAALIESLGSLRVREDRTLDFKRDLNLSDRDQQSEFLRDVTAFANASGGTLLYGVEEGRGDEEGIISGFPGIELPQADTTHRLIEDMLRNSVDERPMGVLHRAVPRDDGRFYYIVRVPPSPLAPHMVMVGRHKSKFFLRANTTTDTMDARQIKETSLRAASAYDRALAVVEERRRVLIARSGLAPEEGGMSDHPRDDVSQLMLHVVPLFPAPGGFAISEARVVERLAVASPLGWSAQNVDRRFTLDGLYLRYGERVRAGYLRSGAAEFLEHPIARSNQPEMEAGVGRPSIVRGWEICQDVLRTLDECAGLTSEGLLPLPLVVCLTLSGVRGSKFKTSPRGSGIAPEALDLDVVPVTPLVLHAWDATAAAQARGAFDELSQAWGLPRDRNYLEGRRIWWSEIDRMPAPAPRFWKTAWEAG
jgi:hypothetical protein